MSYVLHVVGARPNFMKVAPIWRAIAARGDLPQRLVHTGQHYDEKMSDVFFRDLGLPAPDLHLGIGSGSHGEQTAKALIALEKVFVESRPALVSVVGDVNSTLSATLAAAKLGIPLSHVEAGLRSFDRTMPEEINRLVVDRLADHLLTPSPDADENLRHEGVPADRIHRVGNVMIDSLLEALPKARELEVPKKLGFAPRAYGVCTMHRPANVDEARTLERLLFAIDQVGRRLPIIFPVHPRTRGRIETMGLGTKLAGIHLVDPMGYLQFLSLTSEAALVLTDSGGLQEESTALGIPCLTLRENTERPITIAEGTNTLVGADPEKIVAEAARILDGGGKRGRCPDLWDGKTAVRIAELYARLTR